MKNLDFWTGFMVGIATAGAMIVVFNLVILGTVTYWK